MSYPDLVVAEARSMNSQHDRWAIAYRGLNCVPVVTLKLGSRETRKSMQDRVRYQVRRKAA